MQFTRVRDVPLDCSGAFWATRVENKGESAMTTTPQKNRKAIKAEDDGLDKKKGEAKQHRQDNVSELVATFFTPK